MHSVITSCSCVISMDLTVCHKQIAEEWRQQIIVVAKHNLAVSSVLTWKVSRISNLENRGAVCARYSEFVIAHTARFCR